MENYVKSNVFSNTFSISFTLHVVASYLIITNDDDSNDNNSGNYCTFCDY